MGNEVRRRLVLALAAIAAFVPSSAQSNKGQTDSLVRLMKGTSLELIEKAGVTYRKAVDATFLHNGTYLVCDTALWNVDFKTINAWGNVKLIQDETVLTSESLDYFIDDNLAEFRGNLVQLRTKENNVLRSANLDYNTQDSVAVFRGGGAMKDKDGQIIESTEGTYDSKAKMFDFDLNVNMYTDSVFVKTSHLVYDSGANKAIFTDYIDFWNEGNMLSASGGWYNRNSETFFFKGDVHGLSERQECWSDTLYVYRAVKDVEMRGRAQIQDTSRHVSGVAGFIYYSDSLSRVTMKKDAAVAMSTKDKDRVDTLYAGAEKMVYESVRMCDLADQIVSDAQTRLKNIRFDAVTEFRRNAAEAAAKARADAEAKAAENDPNYRPKKAKVDDTAPAAGLAPAAEPAPEPSPEPAPEPSPEPSPEPAPELSPEPELDGGAPDSLSVRRDSVGMRRDSLVARRDSLGMKRDTLHMDGDSLALKADTVAVQQDTVPPLDTTKIGFVTATGKVRIFRRDIQVRCDSLRYCDLDSIARFYIEPVVWNDGNRQYTSDSLYTLVRNGGIDRASLMGNAFIITQEDSICFDQIKGTEVVAYFDTTSALRRFDALGGATAMFYLKEDDALATVNKVESKMLSAIMKDGTVDKVYYFESPKNDAYPVAQLKASEHKMKGFNWQVKNRPSGPRDITSLTIRKTERDYYESRPKAEFKQTDRFFPGYMDGVYKAIEQSRIRKNTPKPDKTIQDADSLKFANDSLKINLDSLKLKSDSLGVKSDSLEVKSDSMVIHAVIANPQKDSVTVDNTAVDVPAPPTKKELREEARKLAIARRDAKWAELDARDAAKAAAKEQKKLEKKRERTRKALIRQARQDAKDAAKLEKYRLRYEKQKAREEARALERELKKTIKETDNEQEPEPSRKRASKAPAGGELQTLAEPVRETP